MPSLHGDVQRAIGRIQSFRREQGRARRAILRRELYVLCNRSTIFLTVLIFFSLPILYLYVV
jgi:hypothetical protein